MTPDLPYAEVIGDPISHSKSPLIHNHWLEVLGIPGEYRATRVLPVDLGDFLQLRRSDPNWRGCNVTMPLKSIIMPLLDTVHSSAEAVGAVNTVRRDHDGHLHGRNSDIHGILCALEDVMLEGATVLLLGAGGAARAAAYALARKGIGALHIAVREAAKGEKLAADLFPTARVVPLDARVQADLLVNATPLGMLSGDPAVEIGFLPDHATVFDMVYEPAETALTKAARARGLRVIGGMPMLIHQAAEAFETLFGRAPAHPAGPERRLRP